MTMDVMISPNRRWNRRWPATLCAALLAVNQPMSAQAPVPPRRDLFIVNARIFDNGEADAISIKNGRIEAVGKRSSLETAVPAGVPLIDAKNGIVVPGFHDAHIHMLSGGLSLLRLRLNELHSLSDVLQAIREYARSHPADRWIVGRGWQYDIVPQGAFPTRKDIDRVVADRPVLLESYDGHSSWANSLALTLAKIDTATPDPEGGQIVREADGRSPSGVLLEGAAALVEKGVPEPDHATKLDALRGAIQYCLHLGITSIDDISSDVGVFTLYDELLRGESLPVRVTVSLPVSGDLDVYDTLRRRYTSTFLRFGFLKGYIDGVIESKTAFMLQPYTGTNECGKPLIGPRELRKLIARAEAKGFTVAFHTIGDAAVRMSLDAFGDVTGSTGEKRIHGRLEHIEVIDPADVRRFNKLGVVASMQPYHSVPSGDTPDDDVWSKNLGSARLLHSFAWRELLDAGATLAFGSDWPVMSADPLWGIAVATTRQDEEGRPKGGWNSHERITAEEAVTAYTAGSAFAVGCGEELGRIMPGFRGDLVILNPSVDLEAPASLWRGNRVCYVVTDGIVRIAPEGVRSRFTGSKGSTRGK